MKNWLRFVGASIVIIGLALVVVGAAIVANNWSTSPYLEPEASALRQLGIQVAISGILFAPIVATVVFWMAAILDRLDAMIPPPPASPLEMRKPAPAHVPPAIAVDEDLEIGEITGHAEVLGQEVIVGRRGVRLHHRFGEVFPSLAAAQSALEQRQMLVEKANERRAAQFKAVARMATIALALVVVAVGAGAATLFALGAFDSSDAHTDPKH